MRIVSIITGLDCGGEEQLLLEICKNNKKENIEQMVIYLTKREYFLNEFIKEGITPVFVDAMTIGHSRAVFKLRRLIRKFRPDIVATHLVRADTLGRAACLFMKDVKVISTIHNVDEWKKRGELTYRLLRLYNRVTVNKFDHNRLIAVSESCRKYCIETEDIRPDKIVTLYNCISKDKFGESVARESLGFNADDFVFINIGRMTAQKSQMDILRAAKALKDEGIGSVKFIILGDGELRKQLEKFIKKNGLEDTVVMPGIVSNVFNYFAVSDMLLMSSVSEGFALVALEAFYNKMPALVTDIPPFKEFITQGETGLFYELHNIQELTGNIKDIINGRHDLKAIAERAHTYFEENIDGDYFGKLYEIYNS